MIENEPFLNFIKEMHPYNTTAQFVVGRKCESVKLWTSISKMSSVILSAFELSMTVEKLFGVALSRALNWVVIDWYRVSNWYWYQCIWPTNDLYRRHASYPPRLSFAFSEEHICTLHAVSCVIHDAARRSNVSRVSIWDPREGPCRPWGVTSAHPSLRGALLDVS